MGEGALFSLGELTGDRCGEGEEEQGSTGELTPPVGIMQWGDVALRIGDGARRNLGLVAGDNARASIWLLGGILIGGGLNFFDLKPSLRGLIVDFLGLVMGEPAGLECGDVGTRVSELVVVLSARGLDSPTSVSEEATDDMDIGTVRVVSDLSDVNSSSGSMLNVMCVVVLLVTVTPGSSSGDSDDSDSVTSVRNSEVSESVSHEAMGASLGLGGISKMVVSGSSALELERSPES